MLELSFSAESAQVVSMLNTLFKMCEVMLETVDLLHYPEAREASSNICFFLDKLKVCAELYSRNASDLLQGRASPSGVCRI